MTQPLELILQGALGLQLPLLEAFRSIQDNLLLPPKEKKMLLDALSDAGTLSYEYGKSFEERHEMSSLFGE